ESLVGSFPAVGGQYGAKVSALRGDLVELAEVGPLIGSEIRQLGSDIEDLRIAFDFNKLEHDHAQIDFLSTVSNQIASCQQSLLSFSPGSAAGCANALSQIQFSEELFQIARKENALKDQGAINQFTAKFEARSMALRSLAQRLTGSLESIDGKLA